MIDIDVGSYNLGLDLVVEAYNHLKILNPQHQLLNLIKPHDVGGGFQILDQEKFHKDYVELDKEKLHKGCREDPDNLGERPESSTLVMLCTSFEKAVAEELMGRLEKNLPLELGRAALRYMSKV